MATEERELTSWKEIASYLGVGVRTAQLWEHQRGLPVHRLPGPRGQVRASTLELEAWRGTERQDSGAAVVAAEQPASTKPRWWIGALALAGLIAAAAVYVVPFRRTVTPSAARFEENQLIVLDSRGQEMWRHSYPARVEVKSSQAQAVDLDGDGTSEVLVTARITEITQQERPLECYSAQGELLWSYAVATPVQTKEHEFFPPFHVTAFAVLDAPQKRKKQIAVTSAHNVLFPSELAILDSSGRRLSGIWHSGHLNTLATNGRLILVGGVRNSNKEATLLAMDAGDVNGFVNEENPHYQLIAMKDARLKARFNFPRSCLNRTNELMNHVFRIDAGKSEIVVHVAEMAHPGTQSSIMYHFSPSLQFRDATESSRFTEETKGLKASCRAEDNLVAQPIADPRSVSELK